MTAISDQTYVRGVSDLKGLAYKQDDRTTPVDLTGYSASYTIKDAVGTVLASSAAGGGITLTIDAANGLVTARIDDATGRSLPVGVHRYDIWIVSSGGYDYCPVRGAFTVVQEVRNA